MMLQTERLILREFVEGDWERVHLYASNPEVVKNQAWGPNTEEQTKEFISYAARTQQQDPRTDYQFAIILKETGELIGGCGMMLEGSEADMGYTLNPDYWGNGYATEAAKALLAFGFEELKLHRMTATCAPTNIGSYKVLDKLGMTREGHLREHMWCRNYWRDSYLYAILDREWNEQK